MRLPSILLLLTLSAAGPAQGNPAPWAPAPSVISTPWMNDVNPQSPLPDYPRPQMVRPAWLNLNGLWQFQEGHANEAPPIDSFAQQILVPFPMESALSGVKTHYDRSWYRRTFRLPPGWQGRRILLHFGAVDWESEVFVNGKSVGVHQGGYDPFTYDITNFLNPYGEQELTVRDFDETNRGRQAVGKQTKHVEGFWYTQVSGIWQTVWLEAVPATYITSLKMVPDVDRGGFNLTVTTNKADPGTNVSVRLLDGAATAGSATSAAGQEFFVPVAQAKLWSPDRPFLYDLDIALVQNGAPVDDVKSYLGLRKIEIVKEPGNDVPQVYLNGKKIVQIGALDQGYWPEGIFTAPTDEALKWNLDTAKKLGLNMLRKHIKIEPDRYYYWADKLGVIIWQDMPSRINPIDPRGNTEFERELGAMVTGLGNHPCIFDWVVFNESCGRYDAERLTNWVKSLDPSRLVTIDSGDFHSAAGDVNDIHNYPQPSYPFPTSKPRFNGEYGVGALKVDGHTWNPERGTDGYIGNAAGLLALYTEFTDMTRSYIIAKGLSGSVYTQLYDVEAEINGYYTYDRKVAKMDPAVLAKIHADMINGASWYYVDVAETSERFNFGQPWLYTMTAPPDGWNKLGFDASSWQKGDGGFGFNHGDRMHTVWNSPEIWLRRTFSLKDYNAARIPDLRLRVRHDAIVDYYLNGVLAYSGTGDNSTWRCVEISPAALNALKPGRDNVLTAHARKTRDVCYVDAGILYKHPPNP